MNYSTYGLKAQQLIQPDGNASGNMKNDNNISGSMKNNKPLVAEISWFKSVILSITLIFVFAKAYSQETEPYIKTPSGMYVENYPDTSNLSRYTDDNEVYRAKNEYYFSYNYMDKNGNAYYFDKPTIETWKFVTKQDVSDTTILVVKLSVLPDLSTFIKFMPDYDQTIIEYKYIMHDKSVYSKRSSSTGLIENKMNIWMHPPRTDLFKILELNPFPYIQQPYKKGNTWNWELQIGSAWGDERWRTWEGTITNNYTYKIVEENAVLATDFGDLKCYKIESSATSDLGETYLTAYFNGIYGFVKLEYVNIDKSKIVLHLINF